MDIRVFSDGEITPPHPIPYVSRAALKRIGNGYLPPPKHCPYCQAKVELVNNEEIYSRSYGEWPYAYSCTSCDAYVGVHKETDIPLGTLANSSLRDARKLKRVFFSLQKEKGWSRNKAYQWLSDKLEIPLDQCHWGWFNEFTCQRAHNFCLSELRGV